MPWFKIDDGFTNSKPVLRIPRRQRASAIGLWTLAGAWSAKELTDGHIHDYLLEEFASTPAMATHLVRCGLWEEVENGWRFRNWTKYQPTREQVEADREREAERKRAYRASKRSPSGTTTGRTVGHQAESGHPDPTRPDPTRPDLLVEDITSDDVTPAKATDLVIAQRPDVTRLCDLLADRIESNGSKRPVIGKTWHDAARLMIDRDKRTEEQITKAINWCQSDEFWRSNVLSMPKLREKYDQMRLQAERGQQRRPGNDIDWDAAMDRAKARDAQTDQRKEIAR